MTPLDAAYNVVSDYPGGAFALAARLGKKPSTLTHELNPAANPNAKLGLETAVKISELTGDHRILHAFAEQLGYRCVRVGVIDSIDAPDVLREISVFAKETGEALIAAHRAIEDGSLTENEIETFEREVADIAPAAVTVAKAMRDLAERERLKRGGRPGTEG